MDLNEWRPYRITTIADVFKVYFRLAKKYTIRMEYDLEDYKNRRINFTFGNLRRASIDFIRFLLVSVFLATMILARDTESILSAKRFETMLEIDRIDLLFLLYMAVSSLLEYLWIYTFWEILVYDSAYNEFIAIQYKFDDSKLESNNKRLLLKYFIIRGYLMGIAYKIYALFFMGLFTILSHKHYALYVTDQVTLLDLVSVLIPFFILMYHLIFVSGQMFLVMFCFEFSIRFLRIRFQQLCSSATIQINRLNPLPTRFMRMYYEIYANIAKFNQSAQNYFFVTELLSKINMIFLTVFYSKQTQLKSSSFLILYISVQMIVNTTLVYHMVSFFATKNLLYYRSLLINFIRFQFVTKRTSSPLYTKARPRNLISMKAKRYDCSADLKKNFFLQTMPSNMIGFTCGRLFLITSYKYVELLLMNLIFILLFYKKLLLKEL
ncbi:hypothetical protein QR98_0072250 [Sarcoptes scabiei]|uniref:Gustatory receptor n=1 Tax=Sarcoptes scabiei TaxID=52283 RepID=A0A132ACI8_SARSC|nr:hypothetical protein QR98_0072250 [Sarcoptes scabiei]